MKLAIASTMPTSHRRTCQYRHGDGKRGSPGSVDDGSTVVRGQDSRCGSPRTVDGGASIARAVMSAPPPLETTTTTTTKKRTQKSSFAAAISPTPSSAASKASSSNTNFMSSAPLLGAAQRRPTKKRPAGIKSSRKQARKLLSRIRSSATTLGKKFSTAKKRLPAPPTPMTSHLKYESSTSSQTSGKAERIAESSHPDDSCPEAAEGGRRRSSLLSEENLRSLIDVDTCPSFEFGEAEVNHFRCPDSSPLLSRSLSTASILSTASSCSESYRSFLDLLNASRTPDMDDQIDSHSMPSLSDVVAVPTRDEGLELLVEGGDPTDSRIPQVALSIDLHELEDAGDKVPCFVNKKAEVEEGADSALVWGALGMLLGSPAPKLVSKKRLSRQAAQNFWCSEALEDDGLDEVPSIEMDEEDSISSVPFEECPDDNTDLEDFVLANEPNASPKIDTDGNEAANSVMAWGALAALLGSPAPTSIFPKKTRRSEMNLWDDGNATDEDLDNLLPFTQDHSSYEDTNKVDNNESNQNVRPLAQKGFQQDVDDDNHSIPSLSATFDDDDLQSLDY